MNKPDTIRAMVGEAVVLTKSPAPHSSGRAEGLVVGIVYLLGYDRFPEWRRYAAHEAVYGWVAAKPDIGLLRATVQDINELTRCVREAVQEATTQERLYAQRVRRLAATLSGRA